MVPYTILLPKYPGYLWAFAKFPGDFRDFSKFPGDLRDFAKFPGCFQDCGVGVGYFIPKPGLLYLFRSIGTLFLSGKRKNPGWATCKILP
jgi:hypothetical protein